MLPQPSHGLDRGCDLPPTENDDARAQRAVLAIIFAEHPNQLTICELAQEINKAGDFAADDAVERAIRDLVGVGVLRCQGVAVIPTRPAMHCSQLWL